MAIDLIAQYTIGLQPLCFSKVHSLGAFRAKCAASGGMFANVDMEIRQPQTITFASNSFSYSQPLVGKHAMVTWDAFYEYVFPSVQGCPTSIVKHAIRSACIDFCARTLIWKQDSTLNDVIAGLSMYTFAPPSGAKVVTPYRVAIKDADSGKDKELAAYSLETLESFTPSWREDTSEYPDKYVLITDDTIRLIGTPTRDLPESLSAGVALKPTRDAEDCPSFLYEDWAEVIAAGALAKLHASKEKVWAIPELVSYYTKLYRDGISRARSKATKSGLRESKDILPVQFSNLKGYN